MLNLELLSLNEVRQVTGINPGIIDTMMSEGSFPTPRLRPDGDFAWKTRDIREWLDKSNDTQAPIASGHSVERMYELLHRIEQTNAMSHRFHIEPNVLDQNGNIVDYAVICHDCDQACFTIVGKRWLAPDAWKMHEPHCKGKSN